MLSIRNHNSCGGLRERTHLVPCDRHVTVLLKHFGWKRLAKPFHAEGVSLADASNGSPEWMKASFPEIRAGPASRLLQIAAMWQQDCLCADGAHLYTTVLRQRGLQKLFFDFQSVDEVVLQWLAVVARRRVQTKVCN